MLRKALKTPVQEQREAIERLAFSRDGKVFLEYLLSALDQSTTQMVQNDDVSNVRMYQGECRTLRYLLSLFNVSDQLLK